jgi:TonB family protein
MLVRFDSPGRDDSRLSVMVALSLLLHGALVFLLFLSPSLPTPKRTFGPVYSVALVSAPGPAPARKGASAPASSASSVKDLLAARTRAPQPATALKRELEPAPIVPLPSMKTLPKTDPSLEKTMAEIRKRAALSPPASAPPAGAALDRALPGSGPPPAKTPGGKEGQEGSLPAAGSGAGGGRQEAYYGMLWSRIRGQWALPPGIVAGDALEAVIGVSILRNGAVTAIHFEKRSGNRFFDDSAIKAIEKATPFPPFPEGIRSRSLEVGIRFHSAELRP